MSVEKKAHAASGWLMVGVVVIGYLLSIGMMILSIVSLASTDGERGLLWLVISCLLLTATIIANCGFFTLQPGQARVCVLFGKYVGTVRDEGLRWANPFYTRNLGMTNESEGSSLKAGEKGVEVSLSGHKHGSKISTRARTYNGERIKVNAKAVFDVDDYESFVYTVTETALRHVASVYAYDHMEDDDANSNTITLRTNIEEVSHALMEELDRRLEMAGIDVIDSRLTHLAYAPEIAQAMLRRQQAEAIIAARKKIVEGAVGMVEMAVDQLSQGGNIELDDERKAAMATNLMVVLCGESEAQPVVNTGTLYH